MPLVKSKRAGSELRVALPTDYEPRPVEHFDVERIILSKGSLDTPEREDFVRRICGVLPNAAVEEQLDTPHNRLAVGGSNRQELLEHGKKTLVFGVLRRAVKINEGQKGICPPHWSYSAYGFCPFRCHYCYLNGSPFALFSPAVRIYVNLPEIVREMDGIVNRKREEVVFFHGKVQDGLALEPLTAYSKVLVPFFAGHRYAKQVVLTKSNQVERLLELDHGGRTVLSWSLNPPEIARLYEINAPSVEARIDAMLRCADAGYPVRASVMPIIPHADWKRSYARFVRRLVKRVPLERFSSGGICMSPSALSLMQGRSEGHNAICRRLRQGRRDGGRVWYAREFEEKCRHLVNDAARSVRPDLRIASVHTP